MKCTIENAPQPLPVDLENYEMLIEFHEFLMIIAKIKTNGFARATLHENIHDKIHRPDYFIYGFGGSHFWVKQIVNNVIGKQIIFVELNQ